MWSDMTKEQKKERIRQRIRAQIDQDHYFYYPQTINNDHYKSDEYQRVAVYARVSTDDITQTTSFELQRKYYEDFVRQHPKWKLVEIYADEGKSGTSLKHREQFNRMIADAKAGKIDLIITKSISRFARNVEDFLSSVRTLAEHQPPIGVFFESEAIYSLKSDSSVALTIQASMAEEESRNKSRSMEASIRMRLDHGLPLTPKLLGFDQNEDGKLILDPATYRIPKLMFFMCLYGYSTQQIADKLTALGKKTYLGNASWASNGVVATLRNERYCGDVFTRKTFTPDVLTHRSIKNRGERPRSRYLDEHEQIVSRDDYMAVQMLLNNSKYRNKSILPELEVITDGLLKGYVVVNPRWGSFTDDDYLKASASAYDTMAEAKPEMTVSTNDGDFDYSGFEIAQMGFVFTRTFPTLSIENGAMTFSMECLRKMPKAKEVQLLVHPRKKTLAVRAAQESNRHSVRWSRKYNGAIQPRTIPTTAFSETLFSLLGWDSAHRYHLRGMYLNNEKEEALLFTAVDASVLIRKEQLEAELDPDEDFIPLETSGKRVVAVPEERARAFGKNFYEEKSMAELIHQTPEEWKISMEGRLFSTGVRLNITPYEEIRAFIQEELGDLFWEDDIHGQVP